MNFNKVKKKIAKYKERFIFIRQFQLPISFKKPSFISFAFRKYKGRLEFLEFREHESRNKSTIKLIKEADQNNSSRDFPWLIVNSDDNYKGQFWRNVPMVSYSTTTRDFSMVCPDFTYDCWQETGLDDYEITRINLQDISLTPPMLNTLGWRGANTNKCRELLVSEFSNDAYDIEFIVWDRTNPKQLIAKNFLSLEEQVKRWRYLIDIEGYGYSARLKIFLSSGRVTFIQDRSEKEWFFEHLKPWEHYVPISHDLSDLKVNFQKVNSNSNLENFIIENARQFSNKFLTRDSAIKRWTDIINNHISHNC